MSLRESGEMYLESIYVLRKIKGSVRSIDIAEYMNYSKPSVSRGVKLLKEDGHIVIDKNGYITLTERGLSVAESIYERHTVLTLMLTSLGVNEAVAAEDACRIEHVISDESFAAVKEHYRSKIDN